MDCRRVYASDRQSVDAGRVDVRPFWTTAGISDWSVPVYVGLAAVQSGTQYQRLDLVSRGAGTGRVHAQSGGSVDYC